jgi:hypothetical protein
MKSTQVFYFVVGGMLILTSGIAFLYFTLFGKDATLQQWISALMLGSIGSIFLTIGNDMGKKS